MEHDLARVIKADPNYQKLVKERSRFGWILTACMMVVYYGYILLVAFYKDVMGARIGNGVMTLAIPVGLAVILFTVLVTGVYVWRANRRFDELTAALRAKVQA